MIIRRTSITLLAAIMAVFVLLFSGERKDALAVGALYDWYAITTNLYSDASLLYYFENLSASTQYTITVQELNVDGTVFRTIKTEDLPAAATTTSFIVNPWEWPVGFGPDDANSYAPLRVIDQFGRTLSEHWISTPCHADWSGFVDLVGVADVCRNDDTIAGFFHDKTNPANSTWDPTYGNLTFLHYRQGTSTTTDIEIFNMDTSATVVDLIMQELVDYQEMNFLCQVSGCSSQLLSVDGTDNFVVLSTDGTVPDAGISVIARSRAYGTDPNLVTFVNGVFDYGIIETTTSNPVNNGQSVFVKSSCGNTDCEWAISLSKTSVEPSATQTVNLGTFTSAVGAVYTDHLVTDSIVGDVDGGNYSWQKSRPVSYTVDSVETTGVTVQWFTGPEQLVSDPTLDPTLYEFILTSSAYSITLSPPFTERIVKIQTEFGLMTVFGHTVLLTFLWFLGFALSNRIQPGNAFLQFILFSAIGILYTFIFNPPILIKILLAMGIPLAAIFIFKGRRETA